jgi:hypothetical protein
MIASFRFMFQNFRFAAVRPRAIPMVCWFEWVIHDEAEVLVVKHAIIQHLAVPWFKHPKLLHLTWHQDHG